MGATVPLGAIALGAIVVEKHFILDRELGGPDSSFSMNPDEFKFMVDSIRNLELALGESTFELTESTIESRKKGRSLYITKNVNKGEILTNKNIRSIRPGNGLHPKYLKTILGKTFNQGLERGTPLEMKMYD